MLEEIDMVDRDTKGHVYEYLLGKIASARQNGQFRTPRHIIQMMVETPQLYRVISLPAFYVEARQKDFFSNVDEYTRQCT
jgi:type I restriction enzyme M protein